MFVAGSPGSGKGYATDKLFGLEKDVSLALSTRTGLKLADSDPFFVHFLWKMYRIKPEQLASLSEQDFFRVTRAPGSAREKALEVIERFMASWVRDRHGMVIETTGRSATFINDLYSWFDSSGYDSMMVFLDVTLETALARNQRRGELGGRALPENVVEDLWSQGRANLPVYEGLFGADLVVVDNNQPDAITPVIKRAVQAFLDRPDQNPVGVKWIERQRAGKRRTR